MTTKQVIIYWRVLDALRQLRDKVTPEYYEELCQAFVDKVRGN